MDYVDWCGSVLQRILGAQSTIPHARALGVNKYELVQLVFGAEDDRDERLLGACGAAAGLAAVGLIDMSGSPENPSWRLNPRSRQLAGNLVAVWQQICDQELEEGHITVLAAVNRLSPQALSGGYTLNAVEHTDLATALGVEEEAAGLWELTEELDRMGLVQRDAAMGGWFQVEATYRGLVWETRRALTVEARFIDGLVAEWETTSVDFKRELRVDTADEKAEFVKDVVGLANTQASGRRWLVVGFDDKTRAYHGRPDPRIHQNRLEQLLAVYTEPVVAVRYAAVDYPAGPVGKLEVLRTPAHLPYTVAKSVGDKKRIEAGDVFVRHGSQTEAPTPAELQALKDEASRATPRRTPAAEA